MTGHIGRASLLALLLGAAACASEGTEPKSTRVEQSVQSPTLPSEKVVTYRAPGSRWRFDVPPAPMRVEATTFDPSTPPDKVKERFELKDGKHLLVRIDVWANPQGLALRPWVDANAAWLHNGAARLEERTVGRARVPALVSDEPRSCQAANIVTAVFAVDEHVVAVTCADGQSPVARGAFETVLQGFGAEGGR